MPNRYKAGDPLKISADAWNRMLDMIGYDVSATPEYTKGSVLYRWIWAKFTLQPGEDANVLPDGVLPRGSPVQIYQPLDLTNVNPVDYQTYPQDFVHQAKSVMMDNFNPQNFGITLEPIVPGEIGRVAVDGIVYANFKMPDDLPYTGSVLVDGARQYFNYVHPLPFDDDDRFTTLRVNSSGFAQVVGDCIALGRSQNIFSYEITGYTGNQAADASGPANIYGLSSGACFNGNLVLENTYLFSNSQIQYDFLIPGDKGFCIFSNCTGRFMPITKQPQNYIAYTTNQGTARNGNVPGSGAAIIYRLSNGLPKTLIPIQDATNPSFPIPLSIQYYNLSSETVGNNKWIQLKYAANNWFVDFEDCGTTPYNNLFDP